jgi:hypothetical protein
MTLPTMLRVGPHGGDAVKRERANLVLDSDRGLPCFEPAGNGVIPVFELAKLEREVLHEKATQALRRS